jgi:hypothetical protein
MEHVSIVHVLGDEGNHFESIDEAATERTTEIFDSTRSLPLDQWRSVTSIPLLSPPSEEIVFVREQPEE